jgi:hypothetical protein
MSCGRTCQSTLRWSMVSMELVVGVATYGEPVQGVPLEDVREAEILLVLGAAVGDGIDGESDILGLDFFGVVHDLDAE